MKFFNSLKSLVLFSITLLFFGNISCQKEDEKIDIVFEKPDVSKIPDSTAYITDINLKLDNGIYYLNEKPFSGFIKEVYPNGKILSSGSFLNGKKHGITKTFFPDGSPKDERSYKDNIGYGRHFGYWENGKMKFDFFYVFDKREGLQKQWYESGNAYCELTFKDDREEGMQKAWRENGKPYINYEVKDGIRYGLQKAGLCYTLKKGELKSSVYEIKE